MFKFSSFLLLFFCGLNSFAQNRLVNLIQISPNVYVHESFLQTKDWGNVSCNGMVFVNNGEAIIFDTPANLEATKELIKIVQDSVKAKIVGVVVNHFHNDCLAGLKSFHDLGIPSYASKRTITLAKSNNYEVPQIGFSKKLTIKAGGKKVKNFYFGAAHTQDNIVSYVPSEKVLFGGCMVKALGASKGNLEDADTNQWSNTIKKVKELKPTIVIPGHGKTGSMELLNYTQKLFSVE